MMYNMIPGVFPDLEVTIQNLIAEDDKVTVQQMWTGAQTGEFIGISATGNTFSINTIDIFWIQDGKPVEQWGITDMMGMMQQLGVMGK